ncbi:hypothetical protein CBL_21112, partial [Carabus blaptoides fortunei]
YCGCVGTDTAEHKCRGRTQKIHRAAKYVRTERVKYVKSLKSGTGRDDIYGPSLWYYDKMGFLDAHLGIRQPRGSTFMTTDSPAEEPSHSAEGEDACSATEQNEEVFRECTEMSDDAEVFSPVGSTVAGESCSSAAHSATPTPRKRRRPVQASETEGSTASVCLQDISAAMQTYVCRQKQAPLLRTPMPLMPAMCTQGWPIKKIKGGSKG